MERERDWSDDFLQYDCVCHLRIFGNLAFFVVARTIGGFQYDGNTAVTFGCVLANNPTAEFYDSTNVI